jgi:LuxR family transcriptional regulator, maltose regulon positive regulatory protein
VPYVDSSRPRGTSSRTPSPHLPAHIVRRGRLADALSAPGTRLVVVTGPAGSGKTVAVRDWLSTLDEPAAWLSLDGRHADPEHLLEAVLDALDDLAPGLHDAISGDDPEDHEGPRALALAAEHLASRSQATLVLDDAHVVDHGPAAGLLAALATAVAPTSLRLVICSRSDPPIPLHRVRLAGELVELREADLRFDPDEAQQFFARFPEVHLDRSQVERLADRTEGWAAGLQFAALSLAGRADTDAFVDRFAGSDRHVADFLLDEVLDRQPEDVRDFLLATSVLGRLRADLCEHVTGRPDAAVLLRRVESENLFLVPLDGEREWFRYHHLFGQLLRRELRVTRPELEGRGHERAAAWFRDHGEPGLAIDHLLEAGHHEEAFDLVTRHLHDYLTAGRHETVRGWLSRLPPDFVDRSPGHLLTVAFAYARSGQIALGRQIVDRARAAASPAEREALALHLDVTTASFAAILGDPDTSIALGREVWERRDEVDFTGMEPDLATATRELWDYLPVGLARAHALLDDRSGVRRWASVLRRQGPSLPGDLVGTLGAEAWAEARNGRLRAGAELAEQALVLGTEQGRGSRRAMIGARAALALVHRERDELDRSVEVLAPHLDSALREGHVAITTMGEIELARVECAQGRCNDAIDRLLRVRRDRAARGTPRFLAAVLDLAECRVRLQVGDVDRAQDLFDDIEPGPERALLEARLALAGGSPATVEPLLAPAQESGNRRHQFEAVALAARAAAQDGDLAAARRALGGVAVVAKREGMLRTFLDEGFDIRDLVTTPAAPGLAVAAASVRGRQPQAGVTLIEPLSERELSVLRYLPSRLSNREIGDELYVSLNTVKSHLKTIYRKLDVDRRDDAVRRARQLGLL